MSFKAFVLNNGAGWAYHKNVNEISPVTFVTIILLRPFKTLWMWQYQ